MTTSAARSGSFRLALLAVLLPLLLASLSAPTFAVPAIARPVLRMGMTDPAVSDLQRRLRMPLVTGYFGPITYSYVRQLQRSAHLRVTGVVDRSTWRVLRKTRLTPSHISSTPPGGSGSLGIHATLGKIAAPIRRFRDGGHAYYLSRRSLHSCSYVGRCMDLFAPVNEPVYAFADGVLVVKPYAPHSYGNHVRIKHNDRTESIYAHLSNVVARSGIVRAGTLIGTAGCSGTSGESNTCRSSESHLHFEWSGLRWKPGEHGQNPPRFRQWRGNPRRCFNGC
jgi:hypothetical protein